MPQGHGGPLQPGHGGTLASGYGPFSQEGGSIAHLPAAAQQQYLQQPLVHQLGPSSYMEVALDTRLSEMEGRESQLMQHILELSRQVGGRPGQGGEGEGREQGGARTGGGGEVVQQAWSWFRHVGGRWCSKPGAGFGM